MANYFYAGQKDYIEQLNMLANGQVIPVQADWTATSGIGFIKNKPDLSLYAQKSNPQFTGAMTITSGAGVGNMIILNSTTSSNVKVVTQDNGVTRGYWGSGAGTPFQVINAANTAAVLQLSDVGTLSVPAISTGPATVTTLSATAITASSYNGYTPVRQGGGPSQLNNSVQIGWTAVSKLRLAVDGTDIDNFAMEAATATAISSAVNSRAGDMGGVGFRNNLYNPSFAIDQRNSGAAITVAAGAAMFPVDRWIINNTTNQSLSAQLSSVPAYEGSDSRSRLRISFTTAPTSGTVTVLQKIESVVTLAGRNVTVSLVAAGETLTGTSYTTQNFGTSGSTSVTTSGTFGVATSLTRKSLTLALGSTVGKTIGANSYLEVGVILPIRTTTAFTLTDVQIEEGATATSFERRPYALELALCQRYYEVCRTAYAEGYVVSGSTALACCFNFKATKRTVPAIILGGATQTGVASPVATNVTSDSASFRATGTTTGNGLFTLNFTADSEY